MSRCTIAPIAWRTQWRRLPVIILLLHLMIMSHLHASEHSLRSPAEEVSFRRQGGIAFRFRLDREMRAVAGRRPALAPVVALRTGDGAVCPLLASPLCDVQAVETHKGVEIRLALHLVDGKLRTPRLDCARLRSGMWYALAVTWDLDRTKPWERVRLYMQGVAQGDLFPFDNADWEPVADLRGPMRLGGGGTAGPMVEISDARWFDAAPDPSRLIELASGCPPLAGEAMGPVPGIDLAGWRRETVYREDFSRPLAMERERDLCRDGRWATHPTAEWVMEGDGRAICSDGRLEMTVTRKEADARVGGVVLWLARELPADVVIEYTLEPDDPQRGLHIAFFASRSLSGRSPFSLGMPIRDGDFKAYHSGELNGYHVSPWACDDQKPRGNANLRKNYGFHLVSCGVDRIAGANLGARRLAIVKLGSRIRVLVDNEPSVAFDDDGATYGPVLGAGWFGLRAMASTGKIRFGDLRIDRLVRE